MEIVEIFFSANTFAGIFLKNAVTVINLYSFNLISRKLLYPYFYDMYYMYQCLTN